MRKSIVIFACMFSLILSFSAKAQENVTVSELMSARIKGDTVYVSGNAGTNNSQKRVSLMIYDAKESNNIKNAVKYVDYGYTDDSGRYLFEFKADGFEGYKAVVNAASNVYTDYVKEYTYVDDDIVFHDVFFSKIYPAEDSYVGATVYTESTKDYDENIKLIMAVYRNNALIGTQIKECNIKEGYHAVNLGNIHVPYDECEIKTFVWKDKLVPITNSTLLENKYELAEVSKVHSKSETTQHTSTTLINNITDDYFGLGLPCTINLELKNEEDICGVIVHDRMNYFVKQYEVSTSTDGTNFKTVSEGSIMPKEYVSEEEGINIYFEECRAKYVRIKFHTGFSKSVYMSEIRVLKSNENTRNGFLQKAEYESYINQQNETDSINSQNAVTKLAENQGAVFFLGTGKMLTSSGLLDINEADVTEKVYKRSSEIYIPATAMKNLFGIESYDRHIPLTKTDSTLKYRIYNNEIILIQKNEITVTDEELESINRKHNPLKATADKLITKLNLRADDGMVRTDELYRREMYYYTLEEFAYNFLNRIRKPDYTASLNVNPKDYAMKTADYLVGRVSKSEYVSYITALEKTPVNDIWGVSGAIENGVDGNWAAGADKGNYYGLDFANNLIAAYIVTKDDVYLQKYIMICDDFFENEIEQISALDADTQSVKRWTRGNTNYMHRAMVVTNTIINLARIAKSDMIDASDVGYHSVIQSALLPVTSDLNRDIFDEVNPESIARIYMSLLADYYPVIAHETKESFVSNQLFEGIRALAYLSNTMNEYKYANEVTYRAEQALLDFMQRNMHADGALLEQSFNYNVDTLEDIRTVYTLMGEGAEEIDDLMGRAATMFASLTKPTGDLPRMGNYCADVEVPEDFDNEGMFNSWVSDVNINFSRYGKMTDISRRIKDTLTKKGGEEPEFTSITFPYSGYTAMRNGWSNTSSHMFMLTARPASGHATNGYNGLELTAYGKKMLVFAGPTWYGETDAPPDQADEYNEFQKYFEESSTYKANTVVIEGYNLGPASKAKETYKETNGNRFLTTDSFDYTEGTWQWGYKNADGDRIDDVTHQRQVFYIKDINSWVVEDTMNNSSKTETYSFAQMWGFFPEIDSAAGGFNDEEIVIGNNSVITNDTEGANLAMYSFSENELSYDLYYGSKGSDRYKGWYAKLISGERIPKPDVHVKFSGEPDKATGVTTLITPFEKNNRITQIDETENGFSAVIDGTQIMYQNGEGETHNAFGVQMTGDTLLCVKKDNKLKVIALGCDEITFNGSEIDVAGDFELIINKEGSVEGINVISAPTDFVWNSGMPEYE